MEQIALQESFNFGLIKKNLHVEKYVITLKMLTNNAGDTRYNIGSQLIYLTSETEEEILKTRNRVTTRLTFELSSLRNNPDYIR